MYKKYKIDKSKYRIEPDGTIVYRVQAVRDILTAEYKITAGTYGGYVENEKNLEQFRNAWIDVDSCIRGNARVCGDSYVIDSTITDEATICDLSRVVGSQVGGNAVISGTATAVNSIIDNNAIVGGATHLFRSNMVGNTCVIGSDFYESATIDRRYPEDQYGLENKKYRLIPIKKGEYEGFFRLQAKRDINNFQAPKPIQAGDLGGIVSGQFNLSICGECWIDYDSVVQGVASVFDYAYVSDSYMYGNSVACSSASLLGSVLYHNAYVGGKARVVNSLLNSKTRVFGSTEVVSPMGEMLCFKSKDAQKELRASCTHELENEAKTSLVHTNI